MQLHTVMGAVELRSGPARSRVPFLSARLQWGFESLQALMWGTQYLAGLGLLILQIIKGKPIHQLSTLQLAAE